MLRRTGQDIPYSARESGNVKVELEVIEGNRDGTPFLGVVVRGNEILDLPRALEFVDARYPGLWDSWDRASAEYERSTPAERAEAGFRFVDHWIFEKRGD